MYQSRVLYAMSSEMARSFLKYSKYNPTPLSLNQLTIFARSGSLKKSFEFLHLELLVRLANIMQEIQLLPEKLLSTPSGKLINEIYEKKFQSILDFEQKDSSDEKVLKSFNECLATMAIRNDRNVDVLSEGVMQMKEKYGIDSSTDRQLSYFLDRYYMSRISIRLLINQHVLLFAPHLRDSKDIVGCVDPNCNVVQVINDAFENSKFLCEHYYLKSPELNLIIPSGAKELKIVYIPSHLYHIIFEIFKNSMRALVENKDEKIKPRPIDVLVSTGKEDLIIKISDQGGGMPRSMMPLIFNYTFTTAEFQSSEKLGGQATMAGYGYGLPLSRLYARYLSGDVNIVSMDGYGTEAYIFLKLRAADADELLPIFSRLSIRKYSSQSESRTDWSR